MSMSPEYYVQKSPPSDVPVGAMWIDTTNAKTYTWKGDVWGEEVPVQQPEEDSDFILAAFKGLTDEEYEAVYGIYKILSGGVEDHQYQSLLIYRSLIKSGWIPPERGQQLIESRDDAVAEVKSLRDELPPDVLPAIKKEPADFEDFLDELLKDF